MRSSKVRIATALSIAYQAFIFPSTVVGETVTVDFEENKSAIKNPLKGWRGQISKYSWGSPIFRDKGIPDSQPIWNTDEDRNLESVRKWYVHWDELESSIPAENNNEDLAMGRIRDYTSRHLGAMPRRNMKSIPRLELFTKHGLKAPTDLPKLEAYIGADGEKKDGFRDHSWWQDHLVKARVERLICRIGFAWNTDSRVAAVQVGTQGKYGEMWGLNKMPDVEQYLGDSYLSNFPQKRLMIRNAGPYKFSNSRAMAESARYGFYLDSFAYNGNKSSPFSGASREPEMTHILSLRDNGLERWRHAPMGGEAPIRETTRNKKRETPGIFKDWGLRAYHLWCIRYFHSHWLGSPEGEELSGGSTEVIYDFHKALGYRFILERAVLDARPSHNKKYRFSFSVRNTGSSPFLYPWLLILSFHEPRTRQQRWQIKIPADVTTWLPGKNPDRRTGVYGTPPALNNITRDLDLTKAESILLPGSSYVLCLSVHDPAPPARPSLRFANKNYWEGGFHPVARVVWEGGAAEGETSVKGLDPFFQGAVDMSLEYSPPAASTATSPACARFTERIKSFPQSPP